MTPQKLSFYFSITLSLLFGLAFGSALFFCLLFVAFCFLPRKDILGLGRKQLQEPLAQEPSSN